MYRSIIALIATAMAVFPVGGAWAAAHTHATKPTVKAKKYKGPIVTMRWGPVEAVVTIKGKKITDVKVLVGPDTQRSVMLDEMSTPILHDEVLKAQSFNVDTVSGATMTSEAFLQSLQIALHKAHFKVSGKSTPGADLHDVP